jgi:protein gp37
MNLATGQYWDQSWSPIRGCSHASPGCDHCWAERMAKRFCRCQCDKSPNAPTEANPDPFFGFADERGWTGRVELIESELTKPLHWKRPRVVALNWMGDLFHKTVPDGAIDRVFAVMALCPHHKFLVLTKRARRMREYVTGLGARFLDVICDFSFSLGLSIPSRNSIPLRNVALGVSVEDCDYLGRIGDVRQTPATMRFLSLEPLLEDLGQLDLTGIYWVICGGESGPGARPMHPNWPRSLRDQCQVAGVPFFFKQWGGFRPVGSADGGIDDCDIEAYFTANIDRTVLVYRDGRVETGDKPPTENGAWFMEPVGKKAAGRLLDGKTWDEMPAWLEAH